MEIRDEPIRVGGQMIDALSAGEGPIMVLLHGAGENAIDWSWVIPRLARTHRVLAPCLPGRLACCSTRDGASPAQFAEFVGQILDAIEAQQAVLVGNSLGGLIAIRVALADPKRVTALIVADSAGLGREINPMIQWIVSPGVSEMGIAWAATSPGSLSRAWMRAGMYFAHPGRAPLVWIQEQQRLALQPGFLPGWVEALRMFIGPAGQRDVVLDRLSDLAVPTLLIWGDRDGVVPECHGRHALERLPCGRLHVIADCGHLPQIEHADEFADVVLQFLAETVEARPTQAESVAP